MVNNGLLRSIQICRHKSIASANRQVFLGILGNHAARGAKHPGITARIIDASESFFAKSIPLFQRADLGFWVLSPRVRNLW
jgi:hypothetical protein